VGKGKREGEERYGNGIKRRKREIEGGEKYGKERRREGIYPVPPYSTDLGWESDNGDKLGKD